MHNGMREFHCMYPASEKSAKGDPSRLPLCAQGGDPESANRTLFRRRKHRPTGGRRYLARQLHGRPDRPLPHAEPTVIGHGHGGLRHGR